MWEPTRARIRWGAWLLPLGIVAVVIGPGMLMDRVADARSWAGSFAWSKSSLFSGLRILSFGLAELLVVCGAAVYLLLAAYTLMQWFLRTPRGRRLLVGLLALGTASWLLGRDAVKGGVARLGAIGAIGVALALVCMLWVWGRGRRLQSATAVFRALSLPSVLALLVLAEGAAWFGRHAHLWDVELSPRAVLSSLHLARTAAPARPAPRSPRAFGRLALVIPKHFTDLPIQVYLDRRILLVRRYKAPARRHRTDSGTYFYDVSGQLLFKRNRGTFLFIREPAAVPEHGLRYTPADPRMGDPDLFEFFFVDLPAGRHLVEFVSITPEFASAPRTPFVLWNKAQITVGTKGVVEVVAFEGVTSPGDRLSSSRVARRAAPAATAVDERIARLERKATAFEKLFEDDPLIAALLRETARRRDENPWVFDLPAAYGGRREYTFNQIHALSTWLLRKLEAGDPR